MDKLAEVLGQLAQTLGMTVNLLWPKVVMVTFYQSLGWLILNVIIAVILIVGSLKLFPYLIEQITKINDGDGVALCTIGLVLLAGIVIFTVGTELTSLPPLVAGVLDPEGVTVLKLLSK